MYSSDDNSKQGRPNLTLVPAMESDENAPSYLLTDGIWFKKVRHLAGLWGERNFNEEETSEEPTTR